MSGTMRIRMYNVGFGDCFLITLPGPHCLLVDCGFHANAAGKYTGDELVAQVLADVKKFMGQPRIDIVIASHRHRDHVFAFSSKLWDEIEVGEAWFPWLDDPDSEEARGMWKKHQRLAMHLAGAFPMLAVSAEAKAQIDFFLWNAGIDPRGAAAMGFRQWSNEHALEKLRSRAKKKRYLPRRRRVPETFETPAIPGLTAHVLGPPRDPHDIAHGEPPAEQTFKRLALAALDENAALAAPPFPAEWRVPPDSPNVITPAEQDRVESLARGADPLFAAEFVDRMINSTSLVLVLEIGSARLLLPGDAEWGTWRLLVGDGKHASKVRDLLESATFFKVGHHGSHNATPEDLVLKHLDKTAPAMVSTKKGDLQFQEGIPLPKLLTALGDRAVRSDLPRAKLPKNFKRGAGDKYIDLTLRM